MKSHAAFKSLSYKPNFNLTVFLYEFKTLLESGLSIVEAVDVLLERGQIYHDVLQPIYDHLRAGKTLSQSMAYQAAYFPDLCIAIIKSNEKTGSLVIGIERYLAYTENIDKIKTKLINSSIYPFTVLVIGIIIFLFLLLYLIPKFSLIYNDLDLNLPFFSNLLIQSGYYIAKYQTYLIGLIIFLFATAFYYRKSITQIILTNLIKIKVFSYYYNILIFTRFYRGLSLMLEGGYPLIYALQNCKDILDQNQKNKIQFIEQGLKQGEKLSDLLEKYQLTTPIANRLIRSGESNGNISRMLEKTADFHDAEISRFIEKLSKVIEPLLMIVIGSGIGFIVILLYLPIFDMVGSL